MSRERKWVIKQMWQNIIWEKDILKCAVQFLHLFWVWNYFKIKSWFLKKERHLPIYPSSMGKDWLQRGCSPGSGVWQAGLQVQLHYLLTVSPGVRYLTSVDLLPHRQNGNKADSTHQRDPLWGLETVHIELWIFYVVSGQWVLAIIIHS